MSVRKILRVSLLAAVVAATAAFGAVKAHAESDDRGQGAFPRAYATFQYMNVVGVAARGRLLVYLDHADTNAPVVGATLTAGMGERKWSLSEPARGVYVAEDFELSAGSSPVSVTIGLAETSGQVILALTMPGGSAKPQEGQSATGSGLSPVSLSVAAMVVVGLGLTGYLVRNRRRRVEILAIAPES